MAKLNLLVLKTSNPEALSKFYGQLGISFIRHRHDTGPIHYASEMDNLVFEIYPLPKNNERADQTLRLGFSVDNLKRTIEKIKNSDGRVIQEPTLTEWGHIAIIEDIDGRKVELKQMVIDSVENDLP